ncbi:alpha-N-arabinofuranosidase [Microbispora sp. GKU 823]|uniref:alpha-N-arabinofuranosidase n=1 Tax=Microbispora sp. GKU 823 TaxID=1652100 RepID=UPI0009CF5E56|nr:alpha-L-arabinofuranosidase C-terminal domain-containing protein [Microbispora sp. GKU 823]OPG12561.1 alpha-L-arabinofuranosidase [Microbispora sp. GKU 823]
MLTADITISTQFHRGPVDRRLFGSFVEHMGRCVYTGIYEPGHPGADPYGFRTDVADLVRELGTTLVRYPGGNFVSGYRWEDGVGPVADRPRTIDLAWRGIEPNEVGTDEFLGWARRGGLIPMMAVNLGTRGVQDAANLVEYCNVEGGTRWSDLRRSYGTPEPHRVPLWCLGNEMDGPWQTGHTSATEYGRLAREAGKAMKMIDPEIEVVVCGSSHRHMPTFGYWEADVLEQAYDVADYVSLHAYYLNDGERAGYLGSGAALDGFIRDVVATADAVGARLGRSKKINLSCDEWNVWTRDPVVDISARELDVAVPITEHVYTPLDAVVVGDLLVALLNNADRVKIGCLSLLVNVSAPILTEVGGAARRQTIFYPTALAARLAHGLSLRTVVSCPEVATVRHGDVPAVAVAATYDEETEELAVFVTNRSNEPAEVRLAQAGPGRLAVLDGWTLTAAGSGEPGAFTAHAADDASATILRLAPESWTALRMERKDTV